MFAKPVHYSTAAKSGTKREGSFIRTDVASK